MALGALAAPGGNVGFDAEGTTTVPISAGSNTIKIKSPLENLKDTFADMGFLLSLLDYILYSRFL